MMMAFVCATAANRTVDGVTSNPQNHQQMVSRVGPLIM